MTKFFNLPPSWNPGYADPEYVQDEGLRRRAFVTKMTPRGSYDNPSVGSGGYALPNYVKKEGYGQGAYFTKMTKRGTYQGPVIPNYLDRSAPKVLRETPLPDGSTAIAFSGTDAASSSSNPYTQFGARAAAQIIGQIMRLPPSERRAAMKRALDAMDPSLFGKAERYSKELTQRGVPVRQALMGGLARAITEGMLAELQRAGRTRTTPQANTLPGLGCYRARGALGALGAIDLSVAQKYTQQITGGATCAPPAGFTWDPAAGGYWRRLKAGETPVNGPCGGTVSQSSDQRYKGKYLQVGPFTIPIDDKAATIIPGKDITSAQYTDLAKQISKRSTVRAALAFNLKFSDGWSKASEYALPIGVADNGSGGASGTFSPDGYVYGPIVRGESPVYFFEMPGTGKRYGLYFKWSGTKAQPGWRVFWKENEPSTVTKLFDGMAKLVAKIVDVVGEVVEAVADLACDLVNNPNAAAAAAAASSSPGTGVAAGVGVGIAQGACAKPTPPPPPPMVGGDGMGTIVMVGAGVLVLAAIIKKKRSK